MAEKAQFEKPNDRFEFVLKVNGNIACQRYFRINGYNERAANSAQLAETIEYCVDLINKDLRDKTNIYNYLTAPQVFKDEAEMNRFFEAGKNLPPMSFVVVEDGEKVYSWDGEKLNPYEKPFNISDYIGNEDDKNNECNLQFSFLDNGRIVRSVTWSAAANPRFVRANIDLSNSKNRFDPVNSPVEYFIMREFIAAKKDIIPEIIKSICVTCSTTGYEDSVKYGDKKYSFNTRKVWEDYVRGFEKAVSKKTRNHIIG